MKRGSKQGAVLVENVIFIILNILFFIVLILFLFTRAGSAAVFEERYAKEIAIIIDASQPGMQIILDIDEDALKKAGDSFGVNNLKDNMIVINDNVVNVKLREKGGYSYSFFNDVDVSYYPDLNIKDKKIISGKYVFNVNEKDENE
jgi:hypothetical protein